MYHFKGSVKGCQSFYYSFHVQNNEEILYVGYGKLVDIFNFSKLRTKPGFDKDFEYDIFIHCGFLTINRALNDVSNLIKTLCKGRLPKYNKTSKTSFGRAIKCIETGVLFKNAAEAARVNNCSASALSKHLKETPGFKQIKGLHYKYADE